MPTDPHFIVNSQLQKIPDAYIADKGNLSESPSRFPNAGLKKSRVWLYRGLKAEIGGRSVYIYLACTACR